MPYNNVETPIIYTDLGLYAKTNGFLNTSLSTDGYFNLDPTINKYLADLEQDGNLGTEYILLRFNEGYEYYTSAIQKIFHLGFRSAFVSVVNAGSETAFFPATTGSFNNTNADFGWGYTTNNRLSNTMETIGNQLQFNGFNLKLVNDAFIHNNDVPFQLNEISACAAYEFQHSADFNMVLTKSNESINTIESKSGKSFISQGWSSPPMWGDLHPWQNCGSHDFNVPYFRQRNKMANGNNYRRSWTINFSFIDKNTDEKGLYPENYTKENINFETSINPATTEITYYGLLDNFTTKVINMTNGFALPVIFQPDKNYQDFAICKIETENFQATCGSPGFFDIQLTLREIW